MVHKRPKQPPENEPLSQAGAPQVNPPRNRLDTFLFHAWLYGMEKVAIKRPLETGASLR